MSNMERNGSNENRGVIIIDLMGDDEEQVPKREKIKEHVMIEYDKINYQAPELITQIITITPKKDKTPLCHVKKSIIPNKKKKSILH